MKHNHVRRLSPNLIRAAGVPGVYSGMSRAAMARGLTALLLATCGATLVHMVEYHLGLGSSGDPAVAARTMLAQSPVRGSLLLILSLTLATVACVARELHSLAGQRRQLMIVACRYGVTSKGIEATSRRRPRRLIDLALCVLLFEVPLYGLSERLWPMIGPMRMHGVLMQMAVHAPVPAFVVQLLAALLLAWIVWLVEYRFSDIRVTITSVRRLLARIWASTPVPIFPRENRGAKPSDRGSPSVLSRPPPRRI